MVNLACAPNLEGIIDKIIIAANIPTIVTIGENCLIYQRSLISSAEKSYDIF